MIQAVIFDLDGTLVQTEKLKAISYAKAVIQLSPQKLNETNVIDKFKNVVGHPREEVSRYLLRHFNLVEEAVKNSHQYDTSEPWQTLARLRMRIYNKILSDPKILIAHLCPYNVALLKWAKKSSFRTGLATMSYCEQASYVIKTTGLNSDFDFIATRDDVENGKPDPEIYLLASRALNIPSNECLVIEDSPAGIKAALNAGMHCIAVTNEFTRKKVQESNLLINEMIVDDLKKLKKTVENYLKNI